MTLPMIFSDLLVTYFMKKLGYLGNGAR